MTDTVMPRVLIADDQQDVLVALQLLLKGEGISTELATSPGAVLEKVASSSQRGQDYDVLLMDMNYARDTTSGREGLDLLSSIKALDQALPVVAMTAWASIDLAVEAMQRGLGDFVQKPWNNARLIHVLREQLAVGKRKRATRNEMIEARAIQQRLIPRESLQLKNFDFACLWQPAREVSGDYCDVTPLNDRYVSICIGDVSGKGLPAALLMSNLQAVVKANEAAGMSPQQLVTQVNHIISQNVAANKFITFFYGIVDTVEHRFTFTNAGHNAPLLLRKSGGVEFLREGGTILGVLPDQEFTQTTVALEVGDRLLLYTDGISEAVNAAGEEFGDQQLALIGQSYSDFRPTDLLREIHQAVTAFHQQEEQDDRTMIVMQVLPTGC
ncbi:MAG: SpoIIE family protein phosphatase [Acidobacteria bacterium]|nr:SpoIIE family protein phosphatase [Acidobacteriota bacterium]